MISNSNSKEAFKKTIEPDNLFKQLSQYDLKEKDYDIALNPFRYRYYIINQILKQYLRENLFIGETEIEMTSPVK